MCTCSSPRQMLAEEREDLVPTVQRLLHPVERPMVVEDAVTGAVVAVELVGLAVLLEFRLVLVHLLRARRAVLVAEDAEQGTRQVPGEVDRRRRRLRVQLLLGHHDASAPQLDAGIDILLLAGIEEGMPPAGARAEQADLAIE